MIHPDGLVGVKKKKQEAAGAAAPLVTYHGGPVLANVKVVTVYWGSAWANDPLRTTLDEFFNDIVESSLLDQLQEYSTATETIGRGTHPNSVLITSDPGQTIDDSTIQTFLAQQIANGTLPAPDANTVYFVFFASGVTVTLQGSSSCQDFCGYHSVTPDGLIVYAVDTYDDCIGCQFTGDLIGNSTVVASHELCESITDPQLNAWFDDNTGNEIGDICEGSTKVVNTTSATERPAPASPGPVFSVTVSPATAVVDGTGPVQFTVTLMPQAVPPPPPPPPPTGRSWTVQTEWSNAQGSCV